MIEFIERRLDGSSRTLWVDVYDDGSFSVYGNVHKLGPVLESVRVNEYHGTNKRIVVEIMEGLAIDDYRIGWKPIA